LVTPFRKLSSRGLSNSERSAIDAIVARLPGTLPTSPFWLDAQTGETSRLGAVEPAWIRRRVHDQVAVQIATRDAVPGRPKRRSPASSPASAAQERAGDRSPTVGGSAGSCLPAAVRVRHAPGMFVVSEAEAAAIRAVFDQRGELSAAVELRRLFPGITDMAEARECARTIAGWRPLPVAPRPVGQMHQRRDPKP